MRPFLDFGQFSGPPAGTMRAALVAVAVAFAIVAIARPLSAQLAYEREPRLRKTVGVAAFRNYTVTPDHIFRDESEGLPFDASLQASLTYTQGRLDRRPDVELVSDRALRERIASGKRYREGILLAREWFNLGVDHYRALRLDRAIENLDRAETLYLEVFQDLVEPFALAELELYRGLALLEKGSGDLAHVAFKRMFAFDPWRRFRRGYYAPATEKALQAALVDFQLTANRDMAFFTPERIDRFLADQKLGALVFAYVDRASGERSELHFVVYERAPGRVAYRDVAPLAGTPDDLSGVDRLVSRWLSCADWEHRREPRSPLDADIFVDMGVAYGFFLESATRRIYHEVGFRTAVAWQLSRSLDLHANFVVQTTFPDLNKDLLRAGTSFRALVGAGFTFRSRRLRYYLHPGVDFAYVGSIEWTTNPSCKFFYDLPADQRPGCDPNDIQSLGTTWLLGLALATGLNVFLSNDLYLDIRADLSAYFVPFEPTEDQNFPMDFSIGVGYAF